MPPLRLPPAPLQVLGPASFAQGYTSINRLVLRNCGLTSVLAGTFAALVELAVLDLDNNALLTHAAAGWMSLAESGLPALRLLRRLVLGNNGASYVPASLRNALPTASLQELIMGEATAVLRIDNGWLTRAEMPLLTELAIGTPPGTVDGSFCALHGVFAQVRCECAVGHGSPDATFCAERAPVLPAPANPVPGPTNASFLIDMPAALAPAVGQSNDATAPTLAVRLSVFRCPLVDGTCGPNVNESNVPSAAADVWLCCDADAPTTVCPPAASGVPTCAAFAALVAPRQTVDSLSPDRQHIAILIATNVAGDEVLGSPTDAFTTLSLVAGSNDSGGHGNDNSDGIWMQVAVSLAVVTVGALIAVAVVKHRRRCEKNRAVSTEKLAALLDAVLTDGGHPSAAGGSLAGHQAQGDALLLPEEVPRKHLERLGDLGQGQFGKVTKALLSGWKSIPSFMIAVKEAKHADAVEELLREAVVMRQFNHPNVLGCIGICTTHGEVAVLME